MHKCWSARNSLRHSVPIHLFVLFQIRWINLFVNDIALSLILEFCVFPKNPDGLVPFTILLPQKQIFIPPAIQSAEENIEPYKNSGTQRDLLRQGYGLRRGYISYNKVHVMGS